MIAFEIKKEAQSNIEIEKKGSDTALISIEVVKFWKVLSLGFGK